MNLSTCIHHPESIAYECPGRIMHENPPDADLWINCMLALLQGIALEAAIARDRVRKRALSGLSAFPRFYSPAIRTYI